MNSWKQFLEQESKEKYFIELMAKVNEARDNETIYPTEEDMFSCFELCPYENVKVVIIGQDPYHGAGQAHGLSFSVKPRVKVPPSLKNIYKELKTDVNIDAPNHGYLVSWAKQGVLMMNTSWSVQEGKAGSHKKFGWAKFTKRVLDVLNDYDKPIVFILWGNHAIDAAKGVTNPKHLLLKGIHPSPLAGGGFFGSKPFSQTNAFLEKVGRGAIDWTIPDIESLPLEKKANTKTKVKKAADNKKNTQKTENETLIKNIHTVVDNNVEDEFYKNLGNGFILTYQKGKMGVTGKDGKEIIPATYNAIFFDEIHNIFIVKKDALYGVIDTKGNIIIKPKYESILPDQDKFYVKGENGTGLVDKQGKLIIEPKYKGFKIVFDSFYLALADYKTYYIYTLDGKTQLNTDVTILEFNFQQLREDLFYLKKHEVGHYSNSDYIRLYNKEGKLINDIKFKEIKPYKGDYAIARINATNTQENDSPDLYTHIDASGKPLYTPTYEDVNDYSEGLAGVKLDGKWGFINQQAEVVVPTMYDGVCSTGFKNGYARVMMDEKWGLIDKNNNLIIPCEYICLGDVIEDKNILNYSLPDSGGYLDLQNTRYKIKSIDNDTRVEYQAIDGGPAPFKLPNAAFEYIEDSYVVGIDKKHGFMNSEGEIFIPAIYENSSNVFWGGIAFVKKEGKWAFINKKHEILTDFEYDEAGFISKGYGVGIKYEINDAGKQVDLWALISNQGALTNAVYNRIGISSSAYSQERKESIQAGYYDWYWLQFENKWGLFRRYDHLYISDNLELTQLTYPKNTDILPFFEAQLNKQKTTSVSGYELFKGKMRGQIDTNSINIDGKPVYLTQDPIVGAESATLSIKIDIPKIILEAKLEVVKAKIKSLPDMTGAASYASYIETYQQKLFADLGQCQRRFLIALSAASLEWLFWRISDAGKKYLNYTYVYKRIEALYALSINSNYINTKLNSELYPFTSHQFYQSYYAAEEKGADENELEQMKYLDEMFYRMSDCYKIFTNHSSHYLFNNNIAIFVSLARVSLPESKRKVFNRWLDNALEKGKNMYENSMKDGLYGYNNNLDEFIPREFFFNTDYIPNKVNNEKSIKQFLENIDWNTNPYLDKDAYNANPFLIFSSDVSKK